MDQKYQDSGAMTNLVAWGLWMNLVDIWEMPPGWGVSGTVPLQHTQGQCVVWHSNTDLISALGDYLGLDTSLALDRDRSQRKKNEDLDFEN